MKALLIFEYDLKDGSDIGELVNTVLVKDVGNRPKSVHIVKDLPAAKVMSVIQHVGAE